MSDSDDDDNVYSDYLTNRRVTVQRKKQPVATYDSDSDDDLDLIGKASAPKRKRSEDILADSDEEESFVTKVVETHNQQLKNKMDDLEEEYRKSFFNDNDGVNRTNTVDRNDALSNVIKTVQTLNKQAKTTTTEVEDKIVEEKDEKVVVAEVSTETGSFPVSLMIMDYECRGTDIRNRRELPLESTFYEVRKELAKKWNCPVDLVSLSYKGVKIDDETTPKDLGFRPLEVPERIDANKLGGSEGQIFEKSPSPEQEVITVDNNADYITLKVQVKNRRKPVHIKATDDTTIQDLKERIIKALTDEGDKKIPPIDKMKVMFDDEYLTDINETCKGVGLEDADCIDIFF